MKILSADEMRNIDRRAIDRFGVPSIVLMENAAIAVVDAIFAHYPQSERVAIVCGIGQNGGDGFAVARHLENRGVVPIVIIAGDRAKISGDALTNLLICERLGIPIYDDLAHATDADLLVDAIFGTGLNRAPSGVYADVIRDIAELRIPVLAIDLPSGANASSGEPFEPCVQAEVTVTFAAPKLCHIFEPAALYCGEVIVADISIPDIAVEEEAVTLALITPKSVQPHIAPRLAATHKGTYGHVAIIAGSPGRSGAAVMCARGAIRAGAGLVTVMTDEETAKLVHAGCIEAMTSGAADFSPPKDSGGLKPAAPRFAAVLIGPGLADDDQSYEEVRSTIASIDLPMIIDASALNAFASRANEINPRSLPRVITPHPGELARIMNRDTKSINGDRIGAAREAARACNCVVVLKGHQTLVAEPDGHVFVNPTGNPGMATGGMGDVLSGVVVALLGRGGDPLDAACAAVYLHGLAGDILKEEIGDIGLFATEVADRIPRAIQRARNF